MKGNEWLFRQRHPLTTLYFCLLIKKPWQSPFLSMTSYSPRPRIHFPTLNFCHGPSLIVTCHHSDVMAVSFPNECSGTLVFSLRAVSDRPKLGDGRASNQSRHTVSSGSTHELNVLLRDIHKHNWWRTPEKNLSLTSSAINMSQHSNLCYPSHIKQKGREEFIDSGPSCWSLDVIWFTCAVNSKTV